ncbi:FtsX-like permease family protein [Enterococcus mundtii]|uniref:ABC3 transporter permease protein domain-containing protein n=1 Tax=Enterococcus mundtii TaxID=53346 RepID=A0ABQ0V9A1_ENTMU|nr:FtsX-like permease family protein [Enterococcus mundtii]GEN17343.1 hypothetical protein LAC02_06240 [Ligilactobacillus acidipiscis]AUB52759.1 hypothetical protein EM4838_07085 [Enterococcus mundtii]MZZ57544.1 FtsX-like permease family protein [Enterococcus mundtii]MZZ60519.1 FtsX-like permease family protein [Enterococcus mundtii]MZZ67504.1 FtsX-like permease family protein [Enterococcus mundtii]
MCKLIIKQFLQHWKIWLSILPIFIVSGLIFSTAFVILNALSRADLNSSVDYGVFMQLPIVIGIVVLFLLTTNAMKQCIDFFDETNDILLLLGASPAQISLVMTGQMSLIGMIGAFFGSCFSLKSSQLFLSTLPSSAAKESLVHIPLQFSWNIIFAVIMIQLAIILYTCMRYCLKNYKKRKGSLSSHRASNKTKNSGRFLGIIALLISVGATVYLYFKNIPDPTLIKEYTQSMSNSMNLLLLLWLSILMTMNFLIRLIFRGIVHIIVGLPKMTKNPMIRTAFYNMQYNIEELIKLIRPVSIITLLVGNFIALFLNTKLLIDGTNDNSYISDLVINLIFVFGAPILISLANVFVSIFLFRIKTKVESKEYFYTGCTPNWIFKMRIIEISIVSLISIIVTFIGMIMFAIPLLRVTYLGGGNIFKANWSINILLSLGTFVVFGLCFISIYCFERHTSKKYVE